MGINLSDLRPAQWKSAPGEFLKVNFLGTRCGFLLRLSYLSDVELTFMD